MQANPFRPRIIERFLLRRAPGVVFGDPRQVAGPGVTTEVSNWSPDQGADILHQRYRDYLRAIYPEEDGLTALQRLNQAWQKKHRAFSQILLSPTLPANPQERNDWQLFLREGIGFTYAEIDTSDTEAYRTFLGRRYKRAAELSKAYGQSPTWTSFAQVNLPEAFPPSGVRLFDWIQFVSLYAPTLREAHCFTVMIPVTPDESNDEQAKKAALVKRIIEIEKPAHTQFDVAFFWAMFRTGEARLGLDTALDVGSRFIAFKLGQSELATGFLQASSHPWNVHERQVIGRDRLQ